MFFGAVAGTPVRDLQLKERTRIRIGAVDAVDAVGAVGAVGAVDVEKGKGGTQPGAELHLYERGSESRNHRRRDRQ